MTRLCLSPLATVVRAGPLVLVQLGADEYALQGRSTAQCVERILARLDAEPDREQLVRELGGVHDPELVGELVETLLDLGVLLPASRGRARGSASRTAGAALVVAQDQPWVAPCVEALGAAGVCATVVAAGFDPAMLAAERPDVVVDALAAHHVTRHRAIAEACRAAGVPSISGYPDRGRFVLGPVSRPPEPGCWLCAHRRSLATRPPEHAVIAASARRRVLAAASAWPPDSRAALYLAGAALAVAALAAAGGVPDAGGMLDAGGVFDVRGVPDAGSAAMPAGLVRLTDLASGRQTWHTVLPVPGCPVCGGPARVGAPEPPAAGPPVDGPSTGGPAAGGGAQRRPVAAVRRRQGLGRPPPGVVDPEYGIVRHLVERPSDIPGLVTVLAEGSLVLDGEGSPRRPLAECARGVGVTPRDARVRALGEALERHAAATVDRRALTVATAGELPGDVLNPARLVYYAPGQLDRLPFRRPDPDARLAWRAGTDLAGREVWLPAAQVHLFWPEHDQFSQVTSHGLACGESLADAAGRALCELVERDAMLTVWTARRPVPLLDLATLPAGLARIAGWLAGRGVRPVLHVLPAALPITTILAVGYGDGAGTPGAVVGAATDPDPRRAVRRALRELASNCELAADELRDGDLGGLPADATQVHTIDDHGRFYFPACHRGAFDFLDDGRPPVPTGSLRRAGSTLVDLASLCHAAGVSVYLADLTGPDEHRCGCAVVRALSPDLVPLWFGAGREPLRHPRLAARSPAADRWPHPLR